MSCAAYFLLDLLCNAGDGATGAGTADDHVDAALHLLEDLFSSAVVVRGRVAGVFVLQHKLIP